MSQSIESPKLTHEELKELTGFTSPLRQLEVLHKRGFVRACRARNGQIVLERPHFLAVCAGHYGIKSETKAAQSINLNFLKKS